MDLNLAKKYAEYDNALNQYFDQVLLDMVTNEFRFSYYRLREKIIAEIFKDNCCCFQEGCEAILYTKHKDYDDMMIKLLEHYDTVKREKTGFFSLYEVELLLIEHYMELCGYRKDDTGYWIEKE